jgi:hypothetical protein
MTELLIKWLTLSKLFAAKEIKLVHKKLVTIADDTSRLN